MDDEEVMQEGKNTIKNHPEIRDWKAAFLGSLVGHRILIAHLKEVEDENYQLRMLLWQLHDCKEKEQLSGAQHSGIYMKCIEKGINFRTDPIEKIWDTLRRPYPWKVEVTAAGENAT